MSTVDDTLITAAQLRELIPVSSMTIWRWQKLGLMPAPVVIRRRNYWRSSEISAWINRPRTSPTDIAA